MFTTERIEDYRIRTGPMGLDGPPTDGVYGAFRIPIRDEWFFLIVSDGEGWEHVSVSHMRHTPRWSDMDHVKRLIWGDDVAVMQLHPPRSEWVNNVSTCLHLWRPTDREIPRPPMGLVGIQSAGVLR